MSDLGWLTEGMNSLGKGHLISATPPPMHLERPQQQPCLPSFPREACGVPNPLLRSALFGATRKAERLMREQQIIQSLGGLEIKHTGATLDQGDLDVWAAVLHLSTRLELGRENTIKTVELLKLLGISDTGKNRKILENRIIRLRTATLVVSTDRYKCVTGLIVSAIRDEKTSRWTIELDRRILPLFGLDQFTLIQWKTRVALRGHPLAQWLHAFYSTHAKPYAYSVSKLHDLSGSDMVRLDHFTEKLKKALEAVTEASRENGEHFVWRIHEKLAHIERTKIRSGKKDDVSIVARRQAESPRSRLPPPTRKIEKKMACLGDVMSSRQWG